MVKTLIPGFSLQEINSLFLSPDKLLLVSSYIYFGEPFEEFAVNDYGLSVKSVVANRETMVDCGSWAVSQ